MARSRSSALPVPIEDSTLSTGPAPDAEQGPPPGRWGWLEALVWALIYAGGLLMSLSLFIDAPHGALALDLQWIGAVGVGAGVGLIGVRAALAD
ncbi:hypothetical protein [Pseudaquabacterium rugosum]|jgi:hypothetical protein|uniref:Uncharacterized protein n=1 Tax=Pseudaquabacterium rugosum TaxID=2984194 RepID=A0ABU9B5M5_9BURK